jgi:hypothetical protein
MQSFPSSLFSTIRNSIEMLAQFAPSQSRRVANWNVASVFLFRSVARLMVPLGMVFVSAFMSLTNAQIAPNMPNPIAAPNPLTTTLSNFRSNMQDKIINAANMMPECKYSCRPTKDVRSFGEILRHVAGISYYLCSSIKGVALSAPASGKTSKTEIIAYLKGSFDYCDGLYASFPDTHLDDPADFWHHPTNKMFILTQVGNHDALHYAIWSPTGGSMVSCRQAAGSDLGFPPSHGLDDNNGRSGNV